jgi:hypothetical protein
MDASKIRAIIIVVVALFAALYLGISAATAQFETVAWVIGGLTLVTCFALGRKIWLLIPFLGAMDLSIRLPGNPSSLMIAQVLVIGFSTLLLLSRKLPFYFRWTELEFWMFVLSVFVIQVYVRHPAGLYVFGGDTVGAKPYMLFILDLVSAILLAGLIVPPSELKTALRLSILGGLINLGVSTIGRFVPAVGNWSATATIRSGDANGTAAGGMDDSGATTREYFLMIFGKNLSLWISSFKSPLTACIHPIWGGLVLLSVVAAGLSGFRNAVAIVGLTYFVAICYRGGFISVAISSLLGILAIAVLAIVNATVPLPPNIQRALTFLPGTWEQRYVLDAKGSTEWRVEIWKEVLTSDRWISNKILGDGLGFSARELAYQVSITDQSKMGLGTSGFDFHRESILASGDYHSGPVQTIRTIGYAGLFAMLLFQIRLGVHAHRLIIRCRGTEWFPLALFIGIPLIWNPIFFLFIFGDFKSQAAILLVGAAMIRMLQNNLPLPAWSKPSSFPSPLNQRTRLAQPNQSVAR